MPRCYVTLSQVREHNKTLLQSAFYDVTYYTIERSGEKWCSCTISIVTHRFNITALQNLGFVTVKIL